MQLYRLISSRFARDLSGEGARRYGGRWNPKGTAVLYTTTSVSLSVLESLVHQPTTESFLSLVLSTIDIPHDSVIQRLEPEDLPPGWQNYPPPGRLRDLGCAWVTKGETLGLEVPSALLPANVSEKNVLLNPAHPDFQRVRIVEVQPLTLDARLRAPL
jgi:RES domain-containing protein